MKPNSIVIFDPPKYPAPWDDSSLPFKRGTRFLYTGEVRNMLGHGIFWNLDKGKGPALMHLDNFRQAADEET